MYQRCERYELSQVALDDRATKNGRMTAVNHPLGVVLPSLVREGTLGDHDPRDRSIKRIEDTETPCHLNDNHIP